MAKSSPWSVKGVDPDARQIAKEAAKRHGMTIGAWVDRAIKNRAERQSDLSPGAADNSNDSESVSSTTKSNHEKNLSVRPVRLAPKSNRLCNPPAIKGRKKTVLKMQTKLWVADHKPLALKLLLPLLQNAKNLSSHKWDCWGALLLPHSPVAYGYMIKINAQSRRRPNNRPLQNRISIP